MKSGVSASINKIPGATILQRIYKLCVLLLVKGLVVKLIVNKLRFIAYIAAVAVILL